MEKYFFVSVPNFLAIWTIPLSELYISKCSYITILGPSPISLYLICSSEYCVRRIQNIVFEEYCVQTICVKADLVCWPPPEFCSEFSSSGHPPSPPASQAHDHNHKREKHFRDLGWNSSNFLHGRNTSCGQTWYTGTFLRGRWVYCFTDEETESERREVTSHKRQR